jgi:hypothetical protein
MASQRQRIRPPRREGLNEVLVSKAKGGGEHKNRKDKRTYKRKLDNELKEELE